MFILKKKSKMDKATTIHVVSEIAVLSVMFVYFDRRLRTIESNMEFIKKNYMHAFEDVYKKLELLKQGILTTQTMSQMNNQNFQDIPNVQKQSKIGKLEKIEKIEKIEEKNQDNSENKELPQIQKRAFTSLISELSILPPPVVQTNNNSMTKVEIIDEEENDKNTEITENDMNEIEKLIEGKKD